MARSLRTAPERKNLLLSFGLGAGFYFTEGASDFTF
jgi:hypothetical protein